MSNFLLGQSDDIFITQSERIAVCEQIFPEEGCVLVFDDIYISTGYATYNGDQISADCSFSLIILQGKVSCETHSRKIY